MKRLSEISAMTTVILTLSIGAPAADSRTMSSQQFPAGENSPMRSSGGLFLAGVHTDSTTFTETGVQLPGCYFSSVAWGDYDNDGDLDLLVCGYNDSITFSKIFRNDTGTFTDINASLIGVQSAHGDVWVDYDNDGDLDLTLMGVDGYMNNQTGFYETQPYTKIYRNDNSTFTDINAGLIPVVYGSVSWGDYDNDGDLDLLLTGSPTGGVTTKPTAPANPKRGFDLRRLTEITGSPTESFIAKVYRNDDTALVDVNAGLPGAWGSSASWGDYDNDGDLDIALTGWGGYEISKIFRNDEGTFVDINAPLQLVVAGHLAWGDFDNDGDLDLLYTGSKPGWSGGFSTIYRNDSGTFVDLEPGFVGVFGSAVAWGDYDNDGDLDVLLSGCQRIWNEDVVTRIYRNDNGSFTESASAFQGVHNCSVAWGDYDNDGDLDIILAGGVSPGYNPPYHPVTKIYRNNNGSNQYTPNTDPEVPGSLSADIDGTSVTLHWDKAADNQTPVNSLMYNIRVGSTSNGVEFVAPVADPLTGFTRIPKLTNANHDLSWTIKNLQDGTYYWSVGAVDNCYASSSFAPEQTFVIGEGPALPQWHMVSLPYQYSDNRATVLFPSAVSKAFGYNGSSYVVRDTLGNGYGYWLKFPTQNLPAPLSGDNLPSTSVHVGAGWNLIGSISQAIPVTQITSEPSGMTTSQFFGYSGSYVVRDTIEPGKAYWVNVQQGGNLILSSTGSGEAARTIRIVPIAESPPPPPSDLQTREHPIPTAFALGQNYPNPFNPITRFDYTLPVDAQVTLRIFNTLGQEVARPVDELQPAGVKSVRFDAGTLPSGVYFYRLQAGTFIDSKKMIFTK